MNPSDGTGRSRRRDPAVRRSSTHPLRRGVFAESSRSVEGADDVPRPRATIRAFWTGRESTWHPPLVGIADERSTRLVRLRARYGPVRRRRYPFEPKAGAEPTASDAVGTRSRRGFASVKSNRPMYKSTDVKYRCPRTDYNTSYLDFVSRSHGRRPATWQPGSRNMRFECNPHRSHDHLRGTNAAGRSGTARSGRNAARARSLVQPSSRWSSLPIEGRL